MSNALRKLLKRAKEAFGKKAQPLPGRTFVRKQGCFNCVHFCVDGPVFEKHKISTAQRDVRVLLEGGDTVMKAAIKVGLRDRNLAEKKAGLCLKGTEGDFVVPTFLCERWVGRVGVDKTQGGIDDLAGELKDKLGDPSVVVDGRHVVKPTYNGPEIGGILRPETPNPLIVPHDAPPKKGPPS